MHPTSYLQLVTRKPTFRIGKRQKSHSSRIKIPLVKKSEIETKQDFDRFGLDFWEFSAWIESHQNSKIDVSWISDLRLRLRFCKDCDLLNIQVKQTGVIFADEAVVDRIVELGAEVDTFVVPGEVPARKVSKGRRKGKVGSETRTSCIGGSEGNAAHPLSSPSVGPRGW